MNPEAALALILDLYVQLGALRAENTRLKNELAEAKKPVAKTNGRAPKGATVPRVEKAT